ncbi:MAG TPA: hypothetical protein VEX42_11480 [Microbacterium sp.]|nr:hypothetical protein [Microbacterium sp.]
MQLAQENTSAGIPGLSRARNVRLVAAAPALWRIVGPSGRVIGHLHAVRQGHDVRYSARRFHAPSRTFRELGEFWSADDAVECVILTR